MDIAQQASPSISIVLATHNGALFLDELLQSLVKQTLMPFEIVISDDASTDRTRDILADFVQTCPVPVLFLQNEIPLGFKDNFLYAASHAKGDWIAFCDQDDIWLPEKLERCAVFCGDARTVLAAHKATLIDAAGRVIGDFNQGISRTCIQPVLTLEPWAVFAGFSVICRRSIIELFSRNQRPPDYISGSGAMAHDRWVYLLANLLGNIALISEDLVRYRQHERNVFGAGGKEIFFTRAVQDTLARSDVYVAAAEKLISLIETLPAAMEEFPAYDKEKAIGLWRRVLDQQLRRNRVYRAKNRTQAALQLLSNAIRGTYFSIPSGQWRPRGLMLDLHYWAKNKYSTGGGLQNVG